MTKYTFLPLYLSDILYTKLGFNSYKIYKSIITYYPFVNNRDVELWFSNMDIFFIVSTGRTGTKWLSDLLNKINRVLVVHEPIKNEAYAHREAIEEEQNAFYYIKNFRKKEIFLRCNNISGKSFNKYGEVNSNLRRHINALKSYIPRVKIVHLVRNGIDVVRSIMNRSAYSSIHPVYNSSFKPNVSDSHYKNWDNYTRFQKICWAWMCENRYMRKRTNHCARFEDILSSYALFKRQILEPLNLELSEDIWSDSVKHPRNVTREHSFGTWDKWTKVQQLQFIDICGKEMKEYGYKIPSMGNS